MNYGVWGKLDLDTQSRIKELITDGNELTSEEQLDKHYDIIQCCLTLDRIEKPSLKWLHKNARDSPSFILNVGWQP